MCSIQGTKRALAISASQHPALPFIDTQKLFSRLGLAGVNQINLGPLRSSSAVNTRSLVRAKQEEGRPRLAKTQLDPYQIEVKLTLCGLGWV